MPIPDLHTSPQKAQPSEPAATSGTTTEQSPVSPKERQHNPTIISAANPSTKNMDMGNTVSRERQQPPANSTNLGAHLSDTDKKSFGPSKNETAHVASAQNSSAINSILSTQNNNGSCQMTKPNKGRLPELIVPKKTSPLLHFWAHKLRTGLIRVRKKLAAPRNNRLRVRLFLVCVLAPTLIVFVYLLIFASNIFISSTKFALRGQQNAASVDMLSIFRSGSSSTGDSYIVYNYIHSLDMIASLNQKTGLIAHYRDRAHDVWYRLWQHPTSDDLITYWQWAVNTKYDPDTGILSVDVKAFSPEMAQKICQGILENSEALVNAMNLRARHDAMELAEEEVRRAEKRILAAQKALQDYREQTVMLDPQAVATGLYGVVNQLEGEVTKTTAELAEAKTFMRGDSSKVVTLTNRLRVLQKQLAAEKQRLASTLENDKPLSSLVNEYQTLSMEQEFAQKQLTSAMTSLERARVEAEAKTLYVESFAKPSLPDESLYPRPFFFTLIFFLTICVMAGLISLIFAAIREHAGF